MSSPWYQHAPREYRAIRSVCTRTRCQRRTKSGTRNQSPGTNPTAIVDVSVCFGGRFVPAGCAL
eukprot:2452849-Rhodomonas_salina.1